MNVLGINEGLSTCATRTMLCAASFKYSLELVSDVYFVVYSKESSRTHIHKFSPSSPALPGISVTLRIVSEAGVPSVERHTSTCSLLSGMVSSLTLNPVSTIHNKK